MRVGALKFSKYSIFYYVLNEFLHVSGKIKFKKIFVIRIYEIFEKKKVVKNGEFSIQQRSFPCNSKQNAYPNFYF